MNYKFLIELQKQKQLQTLQQRQEQEYQRKVKMKEKEKEKEKGKQNHQKKRNSMRFVPGQWNRLLQKDLIPISVVLMVQKVLI